MQPETSQIFDSYLPLYDALPDKWEDAQDQLCERLREVTNAINNRSIGFYLDEELLSGKSLFPSGVAETNDSPLQFRSILRMTVNVGPLIAGVNPPFPHGVVNDVNLTNVKYWLSATNSGTLTDVTMVYPQVQVVGANIIINSPGIFDRSIFFWEYVQEL